MSYDNCAEAETCPVHFRNDSRRENGNTFMEIKYLGEFAIVADVATTLGDILALVGASVISHSVDVYRVGDGPLSDIVDHSTGDALPGTRVYSNTTMDAESARDLADDLIVMIGAGLFNGENL